MKPGTRLKSAVCDTEVMVIKAGDGSVECGGMPMVESRNEPLAAIALGCDGGTAMGKRYIDAAVTVELLCVRPGKGALGLDGILLQVKDAKPLPSSD